MTYSELHEHSFMRLAREQQQKKGTSLTAEMEKLAASQPELHESFVEANRTITKSHSRPKMK